MLIIDQLMKSCMHCLSCLVACASMYTSKSGIWKIDDICEVDKR